MQQNNDEESVPRPAVSSLRSRFEQLAVPGSPTPASSNTTQNDLRSLDATAPRQRASSNTYSNAQGSSSVHHLRTSSSSSDIKVGIHRPPPPPPPARGSKISNGPSPGPSPSPSPLLRPVPIPPSSANASPRAGHLSLPASLTLSTLSLDQEEQLPVISVSSLRNKFGNGSASTTARSQSTRQSVIVNQSAIQSELVILNKPAIPPRPPPRFSDHLNSPIIVTQSPDGGSFPSSSSSSLSPDEFNLDSSPSPPALPARRPSVRPSIESAFTHHNDDNAAPLDRPSRMNAPPLPPPRPRVVPSQHIYDSPSSSSTDLSPTPPPLPVRKGASLPPNVNEDAPPLPSRSKIQINITSRSEMSSPSPLGERKTFGKLPPPPTRIIALGDKLPPARRPQSPSSSDESGEEHDDPKQQQQQQQSDALPDSSQSSRRPPTLLLREGYPEPRLQVPAHTGQMAVSGLALVVANNHHLRIFDLGVGDIPMHTLDGKDLGVRDLKITSLEFKAVGRKEDVGVYVWVGTKDGGIVEVDVRSGKTTGVKMAAHLHPVVHIFRHGKAMVTVDDVGKVLVFSPEGHIAPSGNKDEDVSLAFTQPRVYRIAEKQDFVKLIGGKLWTAARGDQHGAGTAARTPIVRVYDIFAPGSVGRSVLPIEHVGAVTSATILPIDPSHVYLGHEEGFVSLWALDTEDGYPQCVEVTKISVSDVLSLEGVNDKLWAGARNGMISAYDVSHQPWIVTNSWDAHPGLPVLKLAVDYQGVERTGRLCVASIGRDEQLKLWDGLLGFNWIDQELAKREHTFSQLRDLSVLVVSWNVDAARPDSLTGDPANVNFLRDVLQDGQQPDIISFGLQEVIDLESRKMAAKSVILGGATGKKKSHDDGGLSEKVTHAYKRWYDKLVLSVRTVMPPDVTYSVVHTESLIGLFTCIFVKTSERPSLKDLAISTIKRGMGGRYGNKGGIVARFVIEDSSICFVNCHLAAGQSAVRRRNADIAAILEEKAVFPVAEHPLAYVGGGDGTMVMDHEIVFINGDLNYRIDHRRDAIIAATRNYDYDSLMNHDQLLREIKFNRGCRFRGFSEGPLNFLPTYKYDPRSDQYDSSEKHRSPAWCDRVLWRARVPERVRQVYYKRYEANVSDHRPIAAKFVMAVKSLRQEVRERAKPEVHSAWVEEQRRLLAAARKFHARQNLNC